MRGEVFLAKCGDAQKKAAVVIMTGANEPFCSKSSPTPFSLGQGPLSVFQEGVDTRKWREKTKEEEMGSRKQQIQPRSVTLASPRIRGVWRAQ